MTEARWVPGPLDCPYDFVLLNPQGDRHLAFDTTAGQWYRLWQDRGPELLTAGQAVFLRPSDVDVITTQCIIWIADHGIPGHGSDLADELAAGVKGLVLHYAQAAGAH
jgi:hypothetical protein